MQEDGRVRPAAGGSSVYRGGERLAGFGSDVEVLDPPAARADLAEPGRRLADTYG